MLAFASAQGLQSQDSNQPSRLALTAQKIARHYTYVRETRGYNRSPEIDLWNRRVGVPLGSSWCQAFQFGTYDSAAKELHVRNPLARVGSVSANLRAAKQIGSGLSVIPVAKLIGGGSLRVIAGDLLCAKHGGGTERDIGRYWLGHIEQGVSQAGRFVRTIGGNTSSGVRGSQRDGDGVFERSRSLSFFLAAIRVP